MSIDWSTFLLELVNFAILVWLLHRFFYRPVLGAVRLRRQGIQDEMAKTAQTRREAEELLAQGRRNLEEWEQERQRRTELLNLQLEEERVRRVAGLEAALAQERDKARSLEERRLAEMERQQEDRALQQAARFAAKLLDDLAGQEVEQRLIDLFLRELDGMPSAQWETIRATALQTDKPQVLVLSAYTLDAARRDQIGLALRTGMQQEIPLRFEEQRELIAGIQVQLAYWVLGANLRDELRFFAEAADHAR